MDIHSEELAYWYFRLNGFLGNSSLIIHNGLGSSSLATDIDYLGVRFMFRKELYDPFSGLFLEDDNNSMLFKYYNEKAPKGNIYICFCEVKKGTPRFNPSREKENTIRQLLLSLGCVCEGQIPDVITQLLEQGFCIINGYYLTFVAIGNSNQSEDIRLEIPIISWDEVLTFIYNRFVDGKMEKSNIKSWERFDSIKELRTVIFNSNSIKEFLSKVTIKDKVIVMNS